MPQLDVCRLQTRGRKKFGERLVVVLQSDVPADLATRLVAPLEDALQVPGIKHVRPEVLLEGRRRSVIVDQTSSIRVRDIAEVVGSVREAGDRIKRAFDWTYFGV